MGKKIANNTEDLRIGYYPNLWTFSRPDVGRNGGCHRGNLTSSRREESIIRRECRRKDGEI